MVRGNGQSGGLAIGVWVLTCCSCCWRRWLRCPAVFTSIISIISWLTRTDSVLDGQTHRLFQQIDIIDIDLYCSILWYTATLRYGECVGCRVCGMYLDIFLVIQTDHCSIVRFTTSDQIFDGRSTILIDLIAIRLHIDHVGIYRHLRSRLDSLTFAVRNNNVSASDSMQIHGDRRTCNARRGYVLVGGDHGIGRRAARNDHRAACRPKTAGYLCRVDSQRRRGLHTGSDRDSDGRTRYSGGIEYRDSGCGGCGQVLGGDGGGGAGNGGRESAGIRVIYGVWSNPPHDRELPGFIGNQTDRHARATGHRYHLGSRLDDHLLDRQTAVINGDLTIPSCATGTEHQNTIVIHIGFQALNVVEDTIRHGPATHLIKAKPTPPSSSNKTPNKNIKHHVPNKGFRALKVVENHKRGGPRTHLSEVRPTASCVGDETANGSLQSQFGNRADGIAIIGTATGHQQQSGKRNGRNCHRGFEDVFHDGLCAVGAITSSDRCPQSPWA